MSNLNTDEIREKVSKCRDADEMRVYTYEVLNEINRLERETWSNDRVQVELQEREQRTKEACKEATTFEKFADWWLKNEGFSIHESEESILVAVWTWKEQAIESVGKKDE